MIYWQTAYLSLGGGIMLLLLIFSYSSFKEQEYRALFISAFILIVFSISWFGLFLFCSDSAACLVTPLVIILSSIILFFNPIAKNKSEIFGNLSEKFDERDTMFAREEYEPESEKYRKYYAEHPGFKETDDRIRALPPLMSPGSRYYDKEKSGKISDTFNKIEQMTTSVDGIINSKRANINSKKITREIKKFLKDRGADDVGIARLNQMHVYSYVGRGPEEWGSPIVNNHKYIILFTLEMDYFQVEQAPKIEITEETAEKYYQAAEMSISLAEYIRSLGYPARAHISDSNYQLMLVPAAVDAGLGELGRSGYLISPSVGARVRLGGVTTDLPLVCDKPIYSGIHEFCKTCLKCADNCPPNAISTGEEVDVRGAKKWLLDSEKCIYYWRKIGTDCGLCMKVCPFSHPRTLVHNIVRYGIKQSAFARKVSIWGDDLFYGRKVKIV